MPKGSCLRSTIEERLQEGWTVTDDLLALLVEVTSVTASNRQLKKPLEIPRPHDVKKKAAVPPQPGSTPRSDAYAKGIAVLAASSKAVKR